MRYPTTAPTQLLVDGYNLLFAAGFVAVKRSHGDLQRARRGLLEFLDRTLSPDEAQATTIVYDAKDAPRNAPAEMWHRGMRILFARDNEEADDLIEDLIRRAATPKKLLVVTSDIRLQQAARRRRAQVIDSDGWLVQLEQRPASTVRADESHAPAASPRELNLQQAEIEHWLIEFGLRREGPRSP